jgi:hypothetical protein
MLSAAWTNQVPSIFFYPIDTPSGNKHDVLKHGGETGTWAIHQPQNFYYQLLSEESEKLDPHTVVQKILELINRGK